MKKIALIVALTVMLCGCGEKTATQQDVDKQKEVGNVLAENQPTPTDIQYSLERYNLIRRAYWVNGLKEKARAVARPAEVPMGYCVLFSDYGTPIGQFNVDGKVSSLNSYLTGDYYLKYYGNGGVGEVLLPDVDGTYGENDSGIFFFTPAWQYIEWSGKYLYSDTPFKISQTVIGEY